MCDGDGANACGNTESDNFPRDNDHTQTEARAWPSVGERPALRKLGSVSCEVLAWSDDEEMHNVKDDDVIHPYVNLPPKPFHQSATPSTDSEFDMCKPTARKISDFLSTERESEADNTDFEVTFRDQDNSESEREPRPSEVFEILYDYEARDQDELNLTAGSTVKLISKTDEDLWFLGEREDGKRGLFPGNYVKLLGSDAKIISPDEIADPPTGKKSLGRGASAEVFKVVYQGEFVALKKVRDTSDVEALKREAVVINRLRHPNIIHLLGVCLEQPRIGLVLELCDGGSLKELCQTLVNSFVSVRILVDWAAQIASAMKCLTQSLVGTYAWMAPEAYKCQKYSEASDVWSFGVVLWELLTRKDPHQGHLPITVAYLVSTTGFDLPIADNCPLKWKSIMQSCWNVEPEKRPTFAELLDLFNEYREELERTTFSDEQEALVQKVRADIKKEITEIYVKLNERDQDRMRQMCHQLYEQLDIRADGSSKSTDMRAPEVRERRKGKKKIEKQDISQPQECRHLMSIQQPTSSKTDLKVIMFDRQSSSGSNVFGTLPRRDKERLDVHRPLQQNLSISYPNLSDIEDNFVKKCGTLQRKDAIRKKRPALYQHDDNERPAPPFYDPDAENRPLQLPPGRVGASGRRSEGTHEDSSRVKKFLSRFHVHLSPRHRASTMGSDDNYTKLVSPTKVVRNKVSPTDKTNKRHDIQFTQQTTRYVKPPVHQQHGTNGLGVGVSHDPAGRSPRREIGIDEIIPTTPEGTYGTPSIPVKHHHRRTSSDEKGVSRQNAFHNGPNAVRSPVHGAVRSPVHGPPQPNLSTAIPPSSSSYNEPYLLNTRIPAPSTDPYITCPAPHIGVVNNTPYLTMTPKNSVGAPGHVIVPPPPTATVQNDQYIHCPRKPERPITLNLTHAHTPESSGIRCG
ncbi:unnamed protein product [Heligmosomoides polygyrus]|uniref:mitogen-activated protein kinase kinase kinase n=1 Tax=Heligmosomoides polygyrus TaxID=6339 RepID=A0A3P8AWL0_HELPZ|nr:unnamed protein product [Heligmosomoides polygyrus]